MITGLRSNRGVKPGTMRKAAGWWTRGWVGSICQSVDALAALVPFSDSVLTLCFLRADEAAGRCAPVRDLRPCSQRVREN